MAAVLLWMGAWTFGVLALAVIGVSEEEAHRSRQPSSAGSFVTALLLLAVAFAMARAA